MDSIEILEPGGSGEFERLCPDGVVYNLEIEGNHNYFVDGVLVHNCHHASRSKTYLGVLRYFGVLKGEPDRDPDRLFIGVTATPSRSDNVGLENICDKITDSYTIRPAVKDGWLAPIQAHRIETETDISKVKVNAGDFQIGQLEETINTPTRNLLIATKYKEVADREKLGWSPGEKRSAIILDFVDVSAKHSLISIPTLFGLRSTFDPQGKKILEQAEEIERLEKENPGLDLRACPTLDKIKASLRSIDLLAPPVVPAEVKRFSKLQWLAEGAGAYHLVLPERSMLSIRINALGHFEVSKHSQGNRRLEHIATGLPEAFLRAEQMIDPQDLRLLKADASWHRDPPGGPQCSYLYRLDRLIQSQFRSAQEFYVYATKKFDEGDLRYTKGGVSRMIDGKLAAVRR